MTGETVYEADITVTVRGIDDGGLGLPFTVHPFDLVGREALVEIREGAIGSPGPEGPPAWPWEWQGDAPTFAALQALGLGQAQASRAWRVVDEGAVYLWTGLEWIRFVSAFGATGRPGPANVLTASAEAGATGDPAAAALTGTSPGQHLAITVPRGDPGDPGDPGIAGAIAEAADVGDLTDAREGSVLAWHAAAAEFRPIPAPRLGGPWAIASGQFGAGSNINESPRVLATMTIPAQPIAWRPLVLSGSIGMMIHVKAFNETRVEIEVRLGSADGDLIGRGVGVGLSNHKQVILYPHWEHATDPSSTTGVVQANQTASIYVLARRTVGTRTYTIVNGGAQLLISAQPVQVSP